MSSEPVLAERMADRQIGQDGRPDPPGSRANIRRALARSTEAHILFPMIALIALGGIWGTTFTMIDAGRVAARQVAVTSTHEIMATYEAQVVSALREIDRTLKLVQYATEHRGGDALLKELRSKSLLPPDLLFTVAIADATGRIMASTRPFGSTNVADADFFLSQRLEDTFTVGLPTQRMGEWRLRFSRRLSGPNGVFAGIVIVSVDAAYFVSGYEASQLGKHGVLGLLGADGVFRVRRSGDIVTAGDRADYRSIVAAGDPASKNPVSTSSWDGVKRYTATSELYDLPLAVVVGLSDAEQMAPSRAAGVARRWWAALGSLVVLLVLAVLGTMSRQLAATRKRAIDDQRAHSLRVEHIAYHDGLTGLPNRSLFSELLARSIEHSRRYRKQSAVLFLDLDRFKQINDTLGHEAGDQLLQEVARRLKGCVRASDSVARLGGDEFVALLLDLDDERYVATIASQILASIAQPVMLAGREFRITASIGISLYPRDGEDETTLKQNADIAMYRAKEEGRNTFKFYSNDLNVDLLERLSIETGLRQALERDELELHYQVKRKSASGEISGVEALLRWQHPDLGAVAPSRFIPIAEETGLIVPIGKWVLTEACLQCVAWQREGLRPIRMAVNVGARQFLDEALVADLRSVIETTGIDPPLLELEICENVLMGDVDRSIAILAAIHALGIRIAVDDFGVGYAAMSALKRFPLDTIKIDRSVIKEFATRPDERELAAAIIAIARSLSRAVVAQGVETGEQAAFLRDHACEEMQGFFLERPLPADRIAALLRKRPDATDVAGAGRRTSDATVA
jgi:diguanylate cyclase (GGDEF)-like protein